MTITNKSFVKTLAIVFIVLAIILSFIPQADGDARPMLAYGDCLAYDTFNRTNGALGNTLTTGPSSESCPQKTWSGSTGTWSITSNKAGNTQSLGSELLTNGDMSSSTGWTLGTGWSIGSGVATTSTGGSIYQTNITNTSKWIRGCIAGKTIAQFGTAIPIFAITQCGKELLLERAKEVTDPILINTMTLPVQPEEKQPRPLI